MPDRVVDGSELMLKKSNLAKLRKYFLKTNLNCMLLSEVPKNEVNKFGIIKPRQKNKKSAIDIEDIIEKPNFGDAPSNFSSSRKIYFYSRYF